MTTRLEKEIKREIEIAGALYTVTMSPEGVRIVPKGRRKGREMSWQSILSGDAELAEQLRISVDAYQR
ncbi:MAG: hypothetical protein H7Z74_03830 [Anaerolineae bacterium]|nr:hypothetical protein [Gemmatimonadaceae bacterium]